MALNLKLIDMELVIFLLLGAVVSLAIYLRGYSDPPEQDFAFRPLERTSVVRHRAKATPTEPVWQPPKVISGKCWVIDGDTIVINKTHVRLFGIDAPELNHPWGKKAKWELVNLCKGRVITAELDGSSSHDRVVGICRLPDGTDLSEELVKRGLAIDWPKFSGGKYSEFEVEGVRKKLWRCHNRQIGKFVPD